jgi:hypothetical protein
MQGEKEGMLNMSQLNISASFNSVLRSIK